MTVYTAPEKASVLSKVKIFLGGSIEMGAAKNWQSEVIENLSHFKNDAIDIFNPRRTDWDKTWVQDPSYTTKFNEQVVWELFYQDNSNILIYNFEAGTVSPITLLELGLYVGDNTKTKFVVCPEEFQRFGNVKITSLYKGNNVKFYTSRSKEFYQDLALEIQRKLYKFE